MDVVVDFFWIASCLPHRPPCVLLPWTARKVMAFYKLTERIVHHPGEKTGSAQIEAIDRKTPNKTVGLQGEAPGCHKGLPYTTYSASHGDILSCKGKVVPSLFLLPTRVKTSPMFGSGSTQ